MHKEIDVATYLKEMGMSLSTIYVKGITKEALKANAVIFFYIFGIETAETLVLVHEGEQEGSEEVYKCLFVLYKEMKHDDAEYFIMMLKEGVEEMKKEVS